VLGVVGAEGAEMVIVVVHALDQGGVGLGLDCRDA